MKRVVAIACLLALVGTILFLVQRPAQSPPTAALVVLPLPYKMPAQKVSLFERWVPNRPSWSWLWHLKDTVVGRRKVCDFGATVVDFGASAEAFLADHPLPAPAFTGTNGLRIWLLSEQQMSALGRDLRQKPGPEVLFLPRIVTADGMQASLFTGGTYPIAGSPTPVGLKMELLSHARPTGTDVTTIVSMEEVLTNRNNMAAGSLDPSAFNIQTNFEAAARLQLAKGSGAFLLGGPPPSSNQKRIGILLSVNMRKPK
jgi:hypothetical protein